MEPTFTVILMVGSLRVPVHPQGIFQKRKLPLPPSWFCPLSIPCCVSTVCSSVKPKLDELLYHVNQMGSGVKTMGSQPGIEYGYVLKVGHINTVRVIDIDLSL